MATPTASATTKPKRAAARPKRAAASRKSRTSAKPRATATAATSTTRAARAQALAERAILIPVGAALEARDRVSGTVDELITTTRSRAALEQQLKRFERRGGGARKELEREVRRTRTRLERRGRSARRGIDRQRVQASRTLGSNVEMFTNRVENVVQNGVDAGMKLVNGAQGRLPKVA